MPRLFEQGEIAVEQEGYHIKALVACLYLEDHDPLFVFTAHHGIDLIICHHGYPGAVDLRRFIHALHAGIHLYSHAMNDAILLVLVDHIKIIRVNHEIDVIGTGRNKIQVDHLFLIHLLVVHVYPVIGTDIFVDENLVIEFADDLETDVGNILPVGIRKTDLLGSYTERDG